MSVEMIARKDLRYQTRMLKAGDGFRAKNMREAKVLVHLKKAEVVANPNAKIALDDAREKVGLKPLAKETEEIAEVRKEYEARMGKKAFHGWDIATLREKMAEGE